MNSSAGPRPLERKSPKMPKIKSIHVGELERLLFINAGLELARVPAWDLPFESRRLPFR